MRFLQWLFRGGRLPDLAKGRGWVRDVHGESQFQEALHRQYRANGGTEHDVKVVAALIPENANSYDANAVRVEIGGESVGYLPLDAAAEYRSAIGATQAKCSAKIVGGFVLEDGSRAFYGVKLNLAWPPRLK